MNQINIIGRLVEEPKVSHTSQGVVIVSGRIAVARGYNSKENQEPVTDFFNFTAFRGTAEIIQNWCQKGKRVAFSGSLQNQSWTDEQGQQRTKTVILVNEVTLIDKKDNQQQTQYNQPQQQYQQPQYNQQQYNNQYQQQPKQWQPPYQEPHQQNQFNNVNYKNSISDKDLPWEN